MLQACFLKPETQSVSFGSSFGRERVRTSHNVVTITGLPVHVASGGQSGRNRLRGFFYDQPFPQTAAATKEEDQLRMLYSPETEEQKEMGLSLCRIHS